MAKKPMSDAQKYRRADARGRNSAVTGGAQVPVARKLDQAGRFSEGEALRNTALKNLRYADTVKSDMYKNRPKSTDAEEASWNMIVRKSQAPNQGYAKGGKVSSKEGTAKDMREDKAMAKKRGMTMKDWEKSAADKKHDAPKKMAKGGAVHKMPDGTTMPGKSHGAPKKMAEGGKLKMVEKGGKKVPAFAADGVGKMATGGSVRGTGAAIRGKGFSGCY